MSVGLSIPRLRLFGATVLLMAALIAGRLVYLQVLRGSYYAQVARDQAQERIEVDLPRATLVDRHGFPLAASTECPSLYTFEPQKIQDPVGLARAVASVSGRDTDDILKDLRARKKFTWLARKLPFEKYDAARTICQQFKGCEMMEESGRFYPNGPLAANLVGCVGTDGGLTGLEHHWNATLQGGTRHFLVMRDAVATRLIPTEVIPEVAPKPVTVRTTIDQAMQFEAERVLSDTVQEMHAKDGVALLLDPSNGDILAMAVVPTFDPNDAGASGPDAWRNRAVTDSYEPGSTFKLITLAAALDSGRYQPTDTIVVGNGTLTVGPKTIHDDEPPIHAVYTLEEVLAHSSNVGAAKIGMSLGEETMYHYMRLFGFGQPTALHLTGESAGKLRPPKDWSMLSLPCLSFGQELRCTPLQLALAYAAVASGGYRVTPRLLVDQPVTPPERILKASTCEQLKAMLGRVVTEGTGKAAAIKGVAVGGKTGTAQKIGQKTEDGRRPFIAYFAGMAPLDNPRLVCLVMVDEPVGKIYGGQISAPAFAKILGFALKRQAYPDTPSSLDLALVGGRP
jgi:cell division protein FtsI (penicillin-binding protein 3)